MESGHLCLTSVGAQREWGASGSLLDHHGSYRAMEKRQCGMSGQRRPLLFLLPTPQPLHTQASHGSYGGGGGGGNEPGERDDEEAAGAGVGWGLGRSREDAAAWTVRSEDQTGAHQSISEQDPGLTPSPPGCSGSHV